MDELFPRHYDSWKRCITVKCGIPLTRQYVEDRIKTLSDQNSAERKKFIDLYGEH